jgi:hypothetical protein
MRIRPTSIGAAAILAITLAAGSVSALAQNAPPGAPAGAPDKQPDFPPLEKVIDGLEKIVSTSDGAKPVYDLYADFKTGRLVAVLPPNYEKQLLMIACTVSAGDPEAGVMGPTHYARWERYDKLLALVAPDLFSRTEGDQTAKDSVEQLYTGRVILSTPIIAMAENNRPVIELGQVALKNTPALFGDSIFGQYGPSLGALNPALARLTKAKTFPQNLVFEYQAARMDGQIVRAALSIGELSGTPGFKPRKADERFGFFYNWYADFAKEANQQVTERYISRWNLEKADPRLKVSPPKEPIVWYIEHTTPVKFRRYVREGIAMWNQAFEEVGFDGAVVVYQQDAVTGAHMDKDPEDARYNFFRWNVSDLGYAIGPSRTNPYTGEILDADVVWHQGLTRSVRGMLENLSESISTQSFGPETLAFLDEHPDWDPRIRLAPPERRDEMLRARAAIAAGEPAPRTRMAIGASGADCRIGELLAVDLGLADAAFLAGAIPADDQEMLDGLPEDYLGQMIRYISAHEVGHCLGLQHNMIASTIRTLKEINSPGFTGATVGSVMDYVAANINHGLGEVQGPYATPVLGPYDKWVIAYGYGPEDQLDKVRSRVGEPDLVFQSQMAISFGPDPRNNTWEMGADNLEFAKSRLALVNELRAKLLQNVVKDGEPWAVARRRYQALLGTHLQMLSVSSRWLGGSFYNNDFKGDPGNRAPISDIPAERQRLALRMVIDNSFNDAAFGLTPEMIRHFSKEHFYDPAAINELLQDSSYTVHDLIGGVQAYALTLVMNPSTLRRIYDNEFRTSGQADAITLSEVVTTITAAAWTECVANNGGSFSAANPMISSFRRNLQREHINRLVTLALLDGSTSPSLRTISTLAVQELQRIDGLAEAAAKRNPDPYTSAHLSDVRSRIARTVDAAYVIPR